MEIDYLNETYHLGLEESNDYETLAGYIINRLEEIPATDTVFEAGSFLITIVEVAEARIDLVRLEKIS